MMKTSAPEITTTIWMLEEVMREVRRSGRTDLQPQELLALRLGVTSRTIRNWKGQRNYPQKTNFKRVSRAYTYYIKGDYQNRGDNRRAKPTVAHSIEEEPEAVS
jgi:hypothetical protein